MPIRDPALQTQARALAEAQAKEEALAEVEKLRMELKKLKKEKS